MATRPDPRSTLRILHLEDSPLDGELVQACLERMGCEIVLDRVWTRQDYVEALDRRSYDLILADHQLPAFDGEAALEIAVEKAPTTPFIFVSGTLGEEVAVEAMRRGATDFVVKQRLSRLPDVASRALNEATERHRRREAEVELKRLNESLEERVVAAIADREATLNRLAELQKMETIGQLTGGVAHDFNNLLTPIIGNLDLLRRRLQGDARSMRLLDGATQGAERAKTLVQRLLAFARRQVLEARPVDVERLVAGMAELIGHTIGPRITIAIEAEAGLPAARVDPGQLELALLNLAVNARDAMPGGGALRITISRVEVGADHETGLRHGSYVRLSVQDNGVGMDTTTLKRAIEPFYSTKGVGKGTGLGLSMVHGLAGQSGGALMLDSAPGKGTRADIWLPAASLAADPDSAPSVEELPAAPRATILLVDDEDLVREATSEMLADLGHHVVAARSASHAMQLLADGEVEPDLMITDYLMPGMTGADLAAEVRRDRPELPILLATGYANLAGHQMAELPLLPKPFRQAELAVRLAEMLGPRERRERGAPALKVVK